MTIRHERPEPEGVAPLAPESLGRLRPADESPRADHRLRRRAEES